MSNLRLSNRIQCPPGGWRFKIVALATIAPDQAWCGPTHAFKDLVDMVHKRESANGLSLSAIDQIENQVCQYVPKGYCIDEDGMLTNGGNAFAVMSATFKQGTKTLYGWWKNGMRRVDKDEIVRRSYICNECPENRAIEQCSACAMKGVRSIINEIVANTKLPTDSLLKACSICQCSLEAKVRMPLDDLLPHIPADQFARLPSKCWIRDTEPQIGSNVLT